VKTTEMGGEVGIDGGKKDRNRSGGGLGIGGGADRV
jgi:hypothetical protein